MKKVISVIILLAFFGSMIVMTGCFGGDDGIAAIIGAAVIIAIVASGGTSAPAVFAANNRTNVRYALSAAADKSKVTMKIFPLKDGVEQTAAVMNIASTDIKWTDTDGDGNYQLEASSPQIQQLDGYNEYRVKVYYNNDVILEGVQFIKTAEKSGTKNLSVNPTSTTKALMFDRWKNTATTDTFEAFEFNLGTTDITTEVNNVSTELNKLTAAAVPNYSTVDLSKADTVPTNPVVYYYTVSGYVTAADGRSGSTGTLVYIKRKSDNQMINHQPTENGNFTLQNIPDGTYVVTPEKADHTFTPASRDVVVNGANVTAVNFQAASIFAASVK